MAMQIRTCVTPLLRNIFQSLSKRCAVLQHRITGGTGAALGPALALMWPRYGPALPQNELLWGGMVARFVFGPHLGSFVYGYSMLRAVRPLGLWSSRGRAGACAGLWNNTDRERHHLDTRDGVALHTWHFHFRIDTLTLTHSDPLLIKSLMFLPAGTHLPQCDDDVTESSETVHFSHCPRHPNHDNKYFIPFTRFLKAAMYHMDVLCVMVHR